MARKTEDPAVFTVDGKYTDSTPEGPPHPQATPLRQLWTSSAPSHAGHWGLARKPRTPAAGRSQALLLLRLRHKGHEGHSRGV